MRQSSVSRCLRVRNSSDNPGWLALSRLAEPDKAGPGCPAAKLQWRRMLLLTSPYVFRLMIALVPIMRYEPLWAT